MAVERRTFVWKGNDRAFRAHQDAAGVGSTSASYGATSCKSFISVFGQFDTLNSGDFNHSGPTGQKLALDVYWGATGNWVERLSGLSGGEGITEGGDNGDSYYYVPAQRVPHRADHVIFDFVAGMSGNGIFARNQGGLIPTYPLSPCLFGGRSDVSSVTGGAMWVGANATGNTLGNFFGPLSSVKVEPGYFGQQFCVNDGSHYRGWASKQTQEEYDSRCLKFWGGKVTGSGGISGADFGNVNWHTGASGINIKALDVTIQTPYRMSGIRGFNHEDIPQFYFDESPLGMTHELWALNDQDVRETPFTLVRLSNAENIINLTLGAFKFIQTSGTVANLNISDLYMFYAPDSRRKRVSETLVGSPRRSSPASDFAQSTSISYQGTITSTLRCDPCWWYGFAEFANPAHGSDTSVGSPEIIFGPHYQYGRFHVDVNAPSTVTSYPSQSSGAWGGVNIDQVERGSYAYWVEDQDNFYNYRLFNSLALGGAESGTKRFSVTTLNQKEFNPRWDVTTSAGGESGSIAIRGFNNKVAVRSGCTITNLNLDAGVFNIHQHHQVGDTFDERDEVGDIVVLGGYAEEKAYLRTTHPSTPSFNAFYVGLNGVLGSGADFQIRSADAEFDFSQGVYLRSGPVTTGVTGAGFKFTQAPKYGTRAR